MAKAFKLTSPKPFVPTEFEEQEAIFLWAHGRPAQTRRITSGKQGVRVIEIPAIPAICKLPGIEMLFATLNGVKLPIGLVAKCARSGMRADVPDIILDVARHGYHGWRGELKRIKGSSPRPGQREWIMKLREGGYFADVFYGADEVITSLTWYLG
jgi:hypothetical protein